MRALRMPGSGPLVILGHPAQPPARGYEGTSPGKESRALTVAVGNRMRKRRFLGCIVLVVLVLGVVQPSTSGEAAPRASRPSAYIGISPQTQLNRHDLRLMRRTGIGSLRFLIYWSQSEPAPGVFDWTATDAFLTSTSRYGFDAAAGHLGLAPWVARAPPRVLPLHGRSVLGAADAGTQPPLNVGPGRRSCGRLSRAMAHPGPSGNSIRSCTRTRYGPGRSGTRRTTTDSPRPRSAATPPCCVARRRRSAQSIPMPRSSPAASTQRRGSSRPSTRRHFSAASTTTRASGPSSMGSAFTRTRPTRA